MIEVVLNHGPKTTTVVMGPNAWFHIAQVSSVPSPSRVFILSDREVWEIYGDPARAANARFHGEYFQIDPGECSKTLATAQRIFDHLATLAWGRDELIIGIGGGVVTDLAAFVSALWKRGTPLVLCPTSLEAQIDAAIGGKCAVNHTAGKNLIGTFHHPQAILIDPTCLTTLSARDFRTGLAESIKHALIADAGFFDWQAANHDALLNLGFEQLEHFIERNIRIKWSFVEHDAHETGRQRMMLNFGHTIGHAIENVSGGRLRHGECVAIGMMAAAEISARMGHLAPEAVERIRSILSLFELPASIPADIRTESIKAALSQDKKIRIGVLNFVLLKEIGVPFLSHDVPVPLIDEVLQDLAADRTA